MSFKVCLGKVLHRGDSEACPKCPVHNCLRPCGFNADNFSDKCEQKVFNYAGVTCFNEEDFKDVKNMKGGYLAWVENGLPVTKPPEAEL